MKIFVAYDYNEREKWIKEMVIPIIEAFGAEVEIGEATYDGSIPESVKNKIRQALPDNIVGLTLSRQKILGFRLTPNCFPTLQVHRGILNSKVKVLARATSEIRRDRVLEPGCRVLSITKSKSKNS